MVKLREKQSYSNANQGDPGPSFHHWGNPKQLLLTARSNLAVDNCQAMLEMGGSTSSYLHQRHFCAQDRAGAVVGPLGPSSLQH